MLIKRFPAQGFVRLIREEDYEDFKSIRGSIAWPDEGIPGAILMGGLKVDSEVVKILQEDDFRTLSQAVDIINRFAEKYLLWCLYYPNIPESENWLTFLNQRFADHWHLAPWRFRPAPSSGSVDFTIGLIEEMLQGDKLIVPRDGVLDAQLQAGWQNVTSEQKLNGIVALACLLGGFMGDPEGRGTGLLSEAQFQKLYI